MSSEKHDNAEPAQILKKRCFLVAPAGETATDSNYNSNSNTPLTSSDRHKKRRYRPRPDHPKAWTFSSLCDPDRVVNRKDLKRKVNYDLLTSSMSKITKKDRPRRSSKTLNMDHSTHQPPHKGKAEQHEFVCCNNNNNNNSMKPKLLVWEDRKLSISIWSQSLGVQKKQTKDLQPLQTTTPTPTTSSSSSPNKKDGDSSANYNVNDSSSVDDDVSSSTSIVNGPITSSSLSCNNGSDSIDNGIATSTTIANTKAKVMMMGGNANANADANCTTTSNVNNVAEVITRDRIDPVNSYANSNDVDNFDNTANGVIHHVANTSINNSNNVQEVVISNADNLSTHTTCNDFSSSAAVKKDAKVKRTRLPSRASEETWQQRLEELRQYKLENGDCLVPKKYEESQKLGDWVGSQRHQYKKRERGEQTPLSDERFLELDRLGFVWAVRQRTSTGKSVSWEERFKSLVSFKEKYGHCNVPNNWKSVDQKLSNWCCNQRTSYRMRQQGKATPGKITPARIEALEAIGFEWSRVDGRRNRSSGPVSAVENASWDHYFRALVEYKAKYGSFSIAEDTHLPEYKDLRKWMCTQRYLYNVTVKSSGGNGNNGDASDDFKESLISRERVDKLEQIGFVWSEKGESSSSSVMDAATKELNTADVEENGSTG